jgi:hypothetical protein
LPNRGHFSNNPIGLDAFLDFPTNLKRSGLRAGACTHPPVGYGINHKQNEPESRFKAVGTGRLSCAVADGSTPALIPISGWRLSALIPALTYYPAFALAGSFVKAVGLPATRHHQPDPGVGHHQCAYHACVDAVRAQARQPCRHHRSHGFVLLLALQYGALWPSL